MYDFTNVDPVKCCTWLVLPTVYDESLSYGEQLNKFCKALNELIENNNNIPDYVAEMIQKYITSGAIDEVVRNILANYILNVKYPPKGVTPAIGDGSADDTSAIQGCIDYAFNQGGGCVYFPYGKYLSRSLTLRSGVSLVGFDRYSTKIVQRGGDSKPLVSGGNVQNVQISNLTLDGNNEVQTDDLDVVNVLGKDCLFTNLVIKSGFQCFVYNGLGGDLQVDNVVFGGAVKKVAVINGKDSVQFTNVKFNELGKVQGECVLEVGASDGVYRFSSKAVSPLCVSVSGSRNTFNCDIINSTSNFADSGMLNNFNIFGVEVKEQLAKEKSYTGGSISENITGNKSVVASGDASENIAGGKVVVIGRSKSETITENKTENITGNREIDIDGTDSIHVDGVSTVNIGGARTEVFGSGRSIGVTGTNTEEYHDTMTETFDGKHIVNGSDEDNTFSGNVSNIANKFSFNSKEKNFPITFPDKVVDLHDITNNSSINLITIGDSYGTGESAGVIGKFTPWTQLINEWLKPNIYYTNSLGGAGLLTGNKTFIMLLNELAETIPQNIKNSITHVLLAGGYNDAGNSVEENSNALNIFIKQAKLLFPNAKILIACIGWSAEFTKISPISNNVVPAYSNVGKYGGYYITNINYALHKTSWFSDLVHPNQDGQNYITSQLINGILSGSADIIYPLISFKINGVNAGFCSLQNGTIQLMFDKFELTNVPTPSSGNPISLGTLECDYINAIDSPNYNSIPVMFFMADITSNGTKFISGIGILSISGKNVSFTTYALNDNRTSFYSFEQAGSITILPATGHLLSSYC